LDAGGPQRLLGGHPLETNSCHVVMATHEGTIDPGGLDDRQFERSFQEPSADPVVDKNDIASCESHREGAPGDVIGAQIPFKLHVEGANRLVLIRVTRRSADRLNRDGGVRTIIKVHR